MAWTHDSMYIMHVGLPNDLDLRRKVRGREGYHKVLFKRIIT